MDNKVFSMIRCPVTKPAILDWPDCLNVRDLGGLPTDGRRRIRPGALIRSDNLTRLTSAGIALVQEQGLGRIVDVRSPEECVHDPSPFAGDPLHCNRPLNRPDDPWDPAASLSQNYLINLDRNPDLYAAAVEAVATAPAGAVVVHCHSGKDRSGMIIALALSLAGVPADLIAADYAAVSERMRALFTEWIGAVDDPTERDQLAEELSSRPETMITVLDHLQYEYGGAEAYLQHGGLGSAAIADLRDRLIDPAT